MKERPGHGPVTDLRRSASSLGSPSRVGIGVALLTAAVALACEDAPRPTPTLPTPSPIAQEEKPIRPAEILNVAEKFPHVDRIGAKARIQFGPAKEAEAHTPPKAWRLHFDKRGGFAGVCWKNAKGNEGDKPGEDLSNKGFRRLTFWAKGNRGDEVVEFRAGGLGNVKTAHQDSFDVTAGKIKLSSEWKEYVIYVSNADLSSVMTPFCALLHREDNPEGAELFLDDIQYRG